MGRQKWETHDRCAKCFRWDTEAECECADVAEEELEEAAAFWQKDAQRTAWLKQQRHVEIRQGGEQVDRTLDIHLANKVIKAKGRRALSPRTKGAYRAVVCNQVWARKRLSEAGYQTEPWCKLCQ